MGKRSWFSAVKKAVSSSYLKNKKKNDKRSHKSNPKKSQHGSSIKMSVDTCASPTKAPLVIHNPPIEDTHVKPPQNEQIYSIAMAEEAAPAKVICAPSTTHFLGISKEEIGAIKIQTAYRGYTARRGFSPLRAGRRLRMMMQGQAVKHQTASMLMRMQTASRVQSQVRTRRIRMFEVNEALQRQLLHKHEKQLDNIRSSASTWDGSPRSKEQVEARLRNKKEAAVRRERALAYAYTRQQTWRKSSKSGNSAFMDLNNPQWGWCWLERWNVITPLETGTTSTNTESNGNMVKPTNHQSPTKTPRSKTMSSMQSKRSRSPDDNLAASSIKSMISNPRPDPLGLGSGKKGVGSAKKRLLFSDSPRGTNSNTLWWNR